MNTASSAWGTRLTASATASVMLWISRTVFGLLVTYPLLLAIRATGMISGPDGDAVLFRPGSLLLLEMLRLGLPSLGAAFKTALLLSALSATLQLIPLSAALDLLCFGSTPLAARLSRSLRLFPRFLGLGAIALLAQAALLLAASLLSAALKSPLQSDERLASVVPLGLLGLALVACAGVGCVLDVARAVLVREECTWRDALGSALTCLRERPLAVLGGGYPSAAAGAFGYLCALWLMTRVDLSGPATRNVALAFVVHQGAVLFAVAWRVRWLRRALELSAGSDR